LLLICLSLAWVAGIFLGSQLDLPLASIFIGLLPLMLLPSRRHRKKPIIASLCLFIFIGGALYFPSSLPADNESSLSFYNGTDENPVTVTIRGTVINDPEAGDTTNRLRLRVSEIELDGEWREVQGDTLLFVPRYPEYSYGDVLQVTGELETPPTFEDFDYAGYLAHEGIYSSMLYPEIEVEKTGQGLKPLEWLYSLRNRLSRTLAQVLPEPQASLAQGIVLGIRSNIPSELNDNFSETGPTHILAISGLNLAIVAGLMLAIGTWLFGRQRYVYIWLALGAIWLYALITGMNPPVVRSAVMASVFLFAELLGRQRSSITALTFAAAVMVGCNPQLLWSASFQMSFLAVIGLIFIYPPLRDLGRRLIDAGLGRHPRLVPPATMVSDSLAVTLGAITAVWPVVAYYFGIVSLVGPLATLLALPVLPAIITLGALTAGLGLIALPLAQVTGWLAWLFLSYLLLVVNGFAALPLSHVEFGYGNAVLIWVYYPVLALALWLAGSRRRVKQLQNQNRSLNKIRST